MRSKRVRKLRAYRAHCKLCYPHIGHLIRSRRGLRVLLPSKSPVRLINPIICGGGWCGLLWRQGDPLWESYLRALERTAVSG